LRLKEFDLEWLRLWYCSCDLRFHKQAFSNKRDCFRIQYFMSSPPAFIAAPDG